MRHWLIRFGGLFKRERRDIDFAAELEAHLGAHVEDGVRRGLTSAEARRQAVAELGGIAPACEAYREQRGLPFVETTMQDIRYALRLLRKAPVFTIAAVLTLALGIGANTAIFSVLNAVILRPLAYPQPDRLMKLASQFPGFDEFWISGPEFFEFRERTHAFRSVGAYATGDANLSGSDRPQRVRAMVASDDLFTTLGVNARIGRTFDAAETRPGGAPVAVLSYDLWQSAFGGSATLVGQTVDVDGVRRTVVGVMPPAFDVADQHTQIWLPLVIDRAAANRGGHYLFLIGRLADGVAVTSARAELETLLATWQTSALGTRNASGTLHAPDTTTHRLRIDGLHGRVVGSATTAVWVLQGATLLVLLIACANLSTMLLSRAESRRKEFSLRWALGAGRGRLLRQLITEGCLLSLAGATLGLGVAVVGLRALLAAFPDSLPRAVDISVDLPVLASTFIVALATGIVFGVAPMASPAPELAGAALKESGQRTTSGRHTLRRVLVIGEVALAVVLAVGAGLLLRTVSNLSRVDAGFNRSRLVTFGVGLPETYVTPTSRTAFYERLIRELSGTPGVDSVAAMTGLPPLRNVNANMTLIEGYPPGLDGRAGGVVDYYQDVTAGYVTTMGIPVVEGRGFQASDANAPTVLINQTMARTFWPGQRAIGHRLRQCCNPNIPWLTVVGVLKDVKQGGLEKRVGTELYFDAERPTPITPTTLNVVMRTQLSADELAGPIRRVVAALDPSLPVIKLRAMDDVFEDAIGRPRLLAQLLTLFAGLALLLSTIGTYAVLSYMVSERRREIGIRMALGAQRSTVLRMVVAQGARLALTGVAIGVTIALIAGRTLSSLLFGVGATDPATLAAVVALMGTVALVACFVPGHSATRVDPMVALRAE